MTTLTKTLLRLWAAAAAGTAMALPAHAAHSCSTPGPPKMEFGTVSPDAHTDSKTSMTFTCSAQQPGYIRYCVFVPPVPDTAGGIAPRYMRSWIGDLMFDIYSDLGRTAIIGDAPAGSGGFPVYTGTLAVGGGWNDGKMAVDIPLYGRVPAGQTIPLLYGATSLDYLGQTSNGKLVWSYSTAGFPPTCNAGPEKNEMGFFFGAGARVLNTCRITLASDLNFGSVGSLSAEKPGTSTITVRCPAGTSWWLGLDNGANASGSTRRMAGPGGRFVTYELYKDSDHKERWGNVGDDRAKGAGAGEASPKSLTVYGLVPAQASAPAGNYSDTVIVTLTY